MKALGMIEVYSFTAAVCVADIAAKAADVKIIAFDRNRPLSPDVPAPLVMVVKMEGEVAAVRAAVEAGVEYAKSENKYIVSHVIARPDEQASSMAYLMDINKDKFNKKLPKSFFGVDYEVKNPNVAFGLLEIQGLVASIEGLDSMLKTADVSLIHTEKRLGGRLCTLIIKGAVSAVKEAVAVGENKASVLGKVYGRAVIANPHGEIAKFFDFNGDITEGKD